MPCSRACARSGLRCLVPCQRSLGPAMQQRLRQTRAAESASRNHSPFLAPLMTAPKKLRVALYSPGTVGLGHLRRNLLIAQALAESGLQSINLLITEAREASAFVNAMPKGMDCVTLPGLSKNSDGVCRPRYLDLPLQEVIAVRAR